MATGELNIAQLATSAISLTDFLAKADANGLATKTTIQSLSNFLGTVGTLGFKGVLLAADAAVTEDGIYVAGDSGTYTNNGGLVVDVSDQIVLISVTGTQTVFEQAIFPITLTIDALPTSGSTNAVQSGGVVSYISEREVQDPYVSNQIEEIGVTPSSGTNLGISTYFHAVKTTYESKLLEIDLFVTRIGNAVIKVISENQDGTVNLVSDTNITISSTGLLKLQDGVDFNNVLVPQNCYIALYAPSGQALYTYESGATYYDYYTVSGNLTGSNVSKTLTQTNVLLINFKLTSFGYDLSTELTDIKQDIVNIENQLNPSNQEIGVAIPSDGGSVGSNTYVINTKSTEISFLQEIEVFSKTTGAAKIIVLTENQDNTVNVYSSTSLTIGTTGLVTLQNGVDFNDIVVPSGAFVCLYGSVFRYSFKAGTSVNYFDLTGEPIGDNLVKSELRTTNELQINFTLTPLAIENVYNSLKTEIDDLSDSLQIPKDVYNNVVDSTVTSSGLTINYNILLNKNEITTSVTGSTSVSSTTTINNETVLNQTLNYTDSTAPTGIFNVVNSSGDKVKNLSNLIVKRNDNQTVLTVGTDYREFLPQARISGANVSEASLQVDLEFSYTAERIDLLQVNYSGVVSIAQGTERLRDASEKYYIAQPSAGYIPVAYIVVVGSSCTVVPYDDWDGFFYKNNESELLKIIENGKTKLSKTLKKLNAGTPLKIAGYGDSITQCGFSTGAFTANGVNRDNVTYLENFKSDTLASIGLYDFGDGGGTVHTKIGWNWKLKEHLENKYSSTITYNNYGIGGTTTASTTPNGLFPARIAQPIADVNDLYIIAFGMNEIGSGTTYANMVNIINQFKATGAECIIMGVPRPSTNYITNFESWNFTNNILMLAAKNTDSAFVPTLYITDNERKSYFKINSEQFCSANFYNHPSATELENYGNLLKLLF